MSKWVLVDIRNVPISKLSNSHSPDRRNHGYFNKNRIIDVKDGGVWSGLTISDGHDHVAQAKANGYRTVKARIWRKK